MRVVVGGPEEGCDVFWNPVHFATYVFFYLGQCRLSVVYSVQKSQSDFYYL
jgi:hypothetical protein